MLKPLVVDLDGTLIKSDILLESYFSFLKSAPLSFYKPFIWLISGGKASLKARLAEQISLTIEHLPYDKQIIGWLHKEKASGRRLILATASHQEYANQVSHHLGLFDQVIATNQNGNLSAENKRKALVRQFGEKGFDYAGNSRDDLHVWKAANRAFVVNPERGVEKLARSQGNVEAVIKSNVSSLKAWVKAFRFHQWVKNLLIFVPLLAAHRLSSLPVIFAGLEAFAFFGFCASSVYLLNDLLDLEDDRHHPTKRHRPFASGTISIKGGLFAIPLLLLIAFSGSASLLPWPFTLSLAVYYILTLSYSFLLKRIMMLDVLALAILYTLRIIAGAAVFNLRLTFWMLAFSMFIFMSLALIKRYAELRDARTKGHKHQTRGRGYYPDDLEIISSLGAASGYVSVLVLALYIQDNATAHLYRHPEVIWLACPLLLFWISRTIMLTHRGEMHDDPVVYATKDRVSLLIGFLFGAIFWLAA